MKRRITALVLLLGLAAAACGSDSSSDGLASLSGSDANSDAAPDSDDGSTDAALDGEESILAFTECLREEGLDIPDPEFDEGGNLRLRSLFGAGDEVDEVVAA